MTAFKSINYKNEILAGLTVAMTMIPESLSFAILAGLTPLTGLYAAFLMGIITAIFGGRPAMVSGGAGATVVVLIALAAIYGTQYLFAAIIVAGFIQMLVGILKWSQFVRLIPQPVMYGFLNGLAVIIFMAQVAQFETIDSNGLVSWMSGSSLYIMAGLTALTALIVVIFPKITRIIPSSLAAILIVFAIVYFFNINTKKVLDIASVSGSIPSFNIPEVPFTWDTLFIILPFSLVMAGVGLIESLLTLNIVDDITNTKGNTRKESIAQGLANITNGFFGGMGGCAMVAQTLINLDSGSRGRLSGIIAAITILIIILVGGPFIEQIPMAALVGVMMMVAITTFKWVSFGLVRRMPKSDIATLFIVTVIIIFTHNLAVAVFIGVVIASLIFAWDNAIRIRARRSIDKEGRKIYAIYGPLFFGSCTHFSEKFDPVNDPDEIIIDFAESRIVDMSAIEVLKKVCDQYANVGKSVSLVHLNPDSRRLLQSSRLFPELQ